MQNIELLQHLGLSTNEAKVYLALLKLKKGLVTTIAEEAHVNRSTAYDILDYLNQKGLALKYVENNRIGYTTEGPQRIKNWLLRQEHELEKQKEILNQNFDQLKYLFYTAPDKPKFKYFEGPETIEDFFNDSLECLSGENMGYLSGTISTTYASHKYIKLYAKTRFIKKIKGRYFTQKTDAEAARGYIKKYYLKYLIQEPNLIRVKILPTPEKRYLINEINLYDNKFSISHAGKDFFGVIIEDEQVANTQRMIFDVLWKKIREEIKIN